VSTIASKILDAAQKNPGIRTIEICDQIDCDIDLVESVLRVMLEAKSLVRTEVMAPNGRKAAAFWPPGHTPTAAPAAPSLLPAAAKPIPLPVLHATKWLDDEAKPSTETKSIKATLTLPPAPADATKSKVDLAIEFVKAKGIATTAELRQVMGISKSNHPIGWLGYAVKDGRLSRVGANQWTVPSTPAQKPVEALPKQLEEPAPSALMQPLKMTATPAEEQGTDFAAGLFTDGQVHLRIRGDWIALSHSETAALRNLLRGMA